MGAAGTSHTSAASPTRVNAIAARTGISSRLLSWRDADLSEHTVGAANGMIGNLRPASDADIAHLLANPSDITRFLYGSGTSDSERVVLQKAWHAIHFAL